MRKYRRIILLILIAISTKAYAQVGMPDTTNSCSPLIEIYSYWWKLDSLGTNGFRMMAYKEILKCKIDLMPRAFLLEKLGNPNKIENSNKGTRYLYFYYDFAKMPKGFDGARMCWYISFNFGLYDKYVTSIGDGFIDR